MQHSVGIALDSAPMPTPPRPPALPPLTVAMWDFSYLVRRDGAEDEYRNWGRVLDGLVERGYNAVRIDAFPHLIAADARGGRQEDFTILPQAKRFMWGNHEPVQVRPRQGLIEFVGEAARRGLRVGLSSWFNDDVEHRRDAVATPADYARVWGETLSVLQDEDLLQAIAWVDLCNEFPLPLWAAPAYRQLFGAGWPNLLPMLRQWDDEQRGAVQAYLDEPITALRRDFPDLRYTVSLQFIGDANMRTLDTSALDLAEVHVWASDNVRFCFRTGQLLPLLEVPGGTAIHRALGPPVWRRWREAWLQRLARRLDVWADWAGPRGLPLVTTEGWGPINYVDAPDSPDGAEWDWVREICEEAVALALDRGWCGVCTSNFCQPHFPGMWRDQAWHRRVTAAAGALPHPPYPG